MTSATPAINWPQRPGPTPRELMARMGHSTSRAALIYLHSASDRQRTLADAMAARVRSELGQGRMRDDVVARMWHAGKVANHGNS